MAADVFRNIRIHYTQLENDKSQQSNGTFHHFQNNNQVNIWVPEKSLFSLFNNYLRKYDLDGGTSNTENVVIGWS